MSSVEVHVVTPQEEVWVGQAYMVIAHGVDGEVGILEGHMPLLIQLTTGALRLEMPDGSEIVVTVDGGFLHVSSDAHGTRVDVMATEAVMGEAGVVSNEAGH